MSFRKFAVTSLLAASAFAATPAHASFADFKWLNEHKIVYIDVYQNNDIDNRNDNRNDDACHNRNCNSQPPGDGGPNWDHPGFPGDTPVAGVPEPATWAMFLLGFGGIGFMLRRERLKQIAATVASR